ncbi:MAG: potassium transporter TrkA [Candidatus Omnitrophica bacterium]|nr:potassium transporter TrkA [Candidatus Omnitrophota bacterium]
MNLIFVLPAVIVIIIFIFLVKIAAVALNLTGMDEKKAFFQALSAITGTGFTTRDSELIVNNEIRRRIIIVLMILGNAGLVSAITALTFSFVKGGFAPVLVNTGVILLSIVILIHLARRKGFMRKLTKKIQEKLIKSSSFTKRPVEEILRLAEGFGIAEVTLNETCADIGHTLFDSSFRQKEILILAIERGTRVIPAPHANDRLELNDTLICYGKLANIAKISRDRSS